MQKRKILYSWLGNTDIETALDAQGPIKSAWLFDTFDELRVFTDLKAESNDKFQNNLPKEIKEKLKYLFVSLPNGPTNHRDIFEIVHGDIKNKFSESDQLYFHLSSGTPAMQSIWVIISQAYFKANLLETYKGKVKEVILPFNLHSEFIPLDAHKKAIAEIFEPPNFVAEGFEGVIHHSAIMQKAIGQANKLAKLDVPVLIQGESGTGKELFAKGIHDASKRLGKFITVNCGAIPNELLEAELFGYKKGSFTGANADKVGLIEASNNGTLFLDEIGELPIQAQVKLLRVLQENEIQPIGSTTPTKINMRIIAASHKELNSEVGQGRFREDLFFRIAVGLLMIPPLRERKEDIPLIADYLLQQFNKKLDKSPKKGKYFGDSAMNFVTTLPWSGNIRELNNTIIRSAINSASNKIEKEDIENALINNKKPNYNSLLTDLTQPIDMNKISATFEKQCIEKALSVTKSRSQAAKYLGLNSRQALDAKEASYKRILGLA